MKYLISIAFIATSAHGALANDYRDLLASIVDGPITSIVSNEAVWAAVVAQNADTAGYDQAKIDALDAQWREEAKSGNHELIDDLMGRPLSKFVVDVQKQNEGVLTEIFVVDAKGLNVGQSAITSDYWQGDEEKWQVPFNGGSIVIGGVEFDESTQKNQSQISVPVRDGDGNIVGSATFGVAFDG